MSEIELVPKKLSDDDNTVNVEMGEDEIWFIKDFIKTYHPKKIVEIGVSAGGNTVNLLKWKDKNAKLFSIDIANNWYRDNTKLSGFMAEELNQKRNWKFFRGNDYIDVYKEIGKDIDLIIIDTVHALPGEILTFLAVLPQLNDGCVVILHDIHLNCIKEFYQEKVNDFGKAEYCTGLLFGAVTSSKKWTIKTDFASNGLVSNIGAFVVEKDTRKNIKDIFHILFATWHYFPHQINLIKYLEFVYVNYSLECYTLLKKCIQIYSKYFDMNIDEPSKKARVDIFNSNSQENAIEIIECSNICNIDYPDWFKRPFGRGLVLKSDKKSFNAKFKCINDGVLYIYLKGNDVRNKYNQRVPRYVNYVNFKVNNKDIFREKKITWHDNPYIFEKNVKDGEIVEIHCEWENVRLHFKK